MPNDQRRCDAQQSDSAESQPDSEAGHADKNGQERHRPSAAQAEENREIDPPA